MKARDCWGTKGAILVTRTLSPNRGKKKETGIIETSSMNRKLNKMDEIRWETFLLCNPASVLKDKKQDLGT